MRSIGFRSSLPPAATLNPKTEQQVQTIIAEAVAKKEEAVVQVRASRKGTEVR